MPYLLNVQYQHRIIFDEVKVVKSLKLVGMGVFVFYNRHHPGAWGRIQCLIRVSDLFESWHETSQHCCDYTPIFKEISKSWNLHVMASSYYKNFCGYINGLVPKRRNSSAYALELRLFSANALMLKEITAPPVGGGSSVAAGMIGNKRHVAHSAPCIVEHWPTQRDLRRGPPAGRASHPLPDTQAYSWPRTESHPSSPRCILVVLKTWNLCVCVWQTELWWLR